VTLSKEAVNHMMSRHIELSSISDLAGAIRNTVEEPDYVVLGLHGEHIAVRRYQTSNYLVVPYREGGEVKTAFITSNMTKLLRREVIWKRS
jgi:hypothetical protein